MRKILFLAPYLAPVSNAAALRCQSFLDVLVQKGYQVKTLSYGGKADQIMFIKNRDSASRFVDRLIHEVLSGVEVSLRVFMSRSDLVIFSFPPFIPTLFAATCCAIAHKKFILDVRDTYPEPYFQKKLLSESGIVGSLLKKWVGFLYRRAEHVTTVTDSLVDIVKSYGVSSQKVTLVRNGFDPDFFFPTENKFEKFTAVFHGHLSHFRELHLIPELAVKIPEIDFLVIGDGAHGAMFRKENLPNLQYKGHVEHRELAKLISRAHVGLSFRTPDVIGKTAFPVKVYEYIGAGLVTVVTPNGEAGELLEKMELGYQFENYELDAIKTTLINLKSNYEFYQVQVRKILAVREQFSRNKISQKIADIVSHVSQ